MRSYGALNHDLLRPTGYEIATEIRKRGKKVVLGGVHPTYCPDEALEYGDAIVRDPDSSRITKRARQANI